MRTPCAALALAAAAALLPSVEAQAFSWNTLGGAAPLIIGHRGASGYRPEHTLASYALAIQQGADYIEPDLVMTRDGQLIARHEPILDGTTDVASKFDTTRMSTRLLDGVSTTAYFADTFTLAEIKTLRAIQPNAGRDQQYNGQFEIPTLDEVITLAKTQSIATGRRIGIYPELKHSTYTSQQAVANGLSATHFEDTLVATLHTAYGNSHSAPVFIQSFETANLKYLNTVTDLKLVQLMDAWDVNPDGSMDLSVAPYDRPYDFAAAGDPRTFADLLTDEGLTEVAAYADGIGPWKPYLLRTEVDGVDRTGDGKLDARDRRIVGSTGVLELAHSKGLLVHTWTFRDDNIGYMLGFANPQDEMSHYLLMGVDGVFTDFPDTGVLALAAVPEPSTYALMVAGLIALRTAARRRAATGAAGH